MRGLGAREACSVHGRAAQGSRERQQRESHLAVLTARTARTVLAGKTVGRTVWEKTGTSA